MTRPRLFLDLDGVLADFDGGFPRLCGFDHRSCGKSAMWAEIDARPGFFVQLDPFDGASAFYGAARRLSPVILTSAGSGCYERVAREKHAWVRRHLCDEVLVLPVRDGRDKAAFVQAPGDVLVDDYGRNCEAWRAAGGLAIKHEPTDFERTLRALEDVFGPREEWGL